MCLLCLYLSTQIGNNGDGGATGSDGGATGCDGDATGSDGGATGCDGGATGCDGDATGGGGRSGGIVGASLTNEMSTGMFFTYCTPFHVMSVYPEDVSSKCYHVYNFCQ